MRFSRFLSVAALGAAITLFAGIRQAQAAPIIHLPYPGGLAISIIEGYNGGTHQGVELYSLDLTRDDGKTSGSPALAPAAGVVAWAQAPGGEHGCISIQLDNGGGLYTMLCHLILSHAYNNGDHISQGQQLGTVAAPGLVGNNGVSHIHLQLYRVVGGDRSPVPYVAPQGLPLEAISLPPTGAYNDWACGGSQTRGCHMISSNGPGAASSAPATSTGSAHSGAVVTAAGGASSGAASLAGTAAQTLSVGQQVQVIGTGDCLRVHSSPTVSANTVYCLPDGSQSVITDGPQSADGYNWWKLSSLGWAVADYLAPVDGSSTIAAPPSASATAAPAPAASATPPPATSTPPPMPPATPSAAASATPVLPIGYSFSQGDTVVVTGTGDCLNVHSDAGISAQVLECLPDGTTGTISDGPVSQDGYVWYRLDGHGWVDSEYLQAAS